MVGEEGSGSYIWERWEEGRAANPETDPEEYRKPLIDIIEVR
jgi:hypothetical protein